MQIIYSITNRACTREFSFTILLCTNFKKVIESLSKPTLVYTHLYFY